MALVYNRTAQDVENAKKIRSEKVQKSETLTASDIETLEKGTITINTLNRIEDKQDELRTILNNMGYWNTPVFSKNWDYTQIFDKAEFERILKNLDILRNAFYVYSDTPKTPKVSYKFDDINAIEKILYDLEKMTNYVKNNYRECGDIECGLT
jgi:hypothetical protein